MMYQQRIVLYKIRKPISFGRKAQSIGLYDANKITSPNARTVLRGWNPVDTHHGRQLRIRDIQVESFGNERCNQLIYKFLEGVFKSSVQYQQEDLSRILDRVALPKGYACAAKSANQQFVQADDYIVDGATLLKDDQLIGLLSGYSNFGSMHYTYIDIAFYRSWIKRISGV
ncbi:hypothetical protein QAD02_018914 [Eretmocerus hayati]|uniref:Uncharacterized protein n=1 Tax=Eretmocerus hayati TaxID=131215 RepID=A0ACC2PIC4_9HYME|nr:hypothetical protein QAD02_018914 [Eretmocerus hayati]